MGASILQGCVSIKKSPLQSPCGSVGILEAWASPFCLNSQTSNLNKSREMGELWCFFPVCFCPQRLTGEIKTKLRVPSLGRLKVTRDLGLGRYLCQIPACKVPKSADGNYYFHTNAQDYLTGFKVSGSQGCARDRGLKDEERCKSKGCGESKFNNKKEQDTRMLSLSSW